VFNIQILQDVTLYNSITAVSGVTCNTLTVSDVGTIDTLGVGTTTPDATKSLHVVGDVLINGKLSAVGDAFFQNTVFQTTTAITVNNAGTGPALSALQTGNEAIAAFYDLESGVSLYVDGHSARPGYVGVKTETPNVELTVVGDISASGWVYGDNILRKMKFIIGDGSSNSFECIHSWNTDDVIATVIDASTKAVVYPSLVFATLSSLTVEFANVPSASAYKLTIVG
jgi:hypothetical protein